MCSLVRSNEACTIGYSVIDPAYCFKNRYQEVKAQVQKKLRVVKQQQLELEAANAKGNSRQVFQIVKSMTRKFQPRLQCIQSATGESLTEAAQIADRWEGYCEDLYHDEEGNGIEQEY